MTGSLISMAAEALVALLLIITIGYCVLLNKRLKRLRADESDLRATISELVMATEIAERAIGGLREAALDCDKTLAARMREAEYFSIEIAREIGEGQKVLARIKQIASAVRRADAQSHAQAEEAASTAGAAQTSEQGVPPPLPPEATEIRGVSNASDLSYRMSIAGVHAGGETETTEPAVSLPVEDVRVSEVQKRASRVDELRALAEQARIRLMEMRRVNAEKAA